MAEHQHRQYELVYIVSPEVGDTEVADLHTQIETLVGRFGGKIDSTENWGRRKLAYDIGHHREGTYVLEVITGPGELVKELDRRLRVIDPVIRHLVVRVDEDMKIAERVREERKAAVAKRRAARGLPPEPEPTESPVGSVEGDQDAQDRGAEGMEV